MKHLLTYNESVRDMMTPKSKDDVDKVIDNFFKVNPDIKIFNWKKFGFDFISYQVKPSLYSFVFIAPDDLYWYLFIWKDGTLELRTSHFQEKGVRFKTNDEIEWYLGTKYEPINESIRDKMTPKPEESIKISLRDYFKRRKVRNPAKSILDLGFLNVNNLYFINDENKYYDQIDDYTSELVWSLKGEVLKFPGKEYRIYPDAGIVRYWNLGALEGIYFDGRHLDDIIEYIADDKLSESVKDKMTPKSSADIEKDVEGKNPLNIFEKACRAGVVDYVRKNIKSYPKTWLGSCLWKAASAGYLEVVKILVENGADVNYMSDIPFRYAVVNKHYDVAEYLLENGADVNSVRPSSNNTDEKLLNLLKKYKDME